MSLTKWVAIGVPVILLARGSGGESRTALVGTSYSESFESRMGGWMPDHHLACEPAGRLLEWHILRSAARAYHGVYALDCYLNGDHMGGIGWTGRSFGCSLLWAY